jgi:hypothetical protein
MCLGNSIRIHFREEVDEFSKGLFNFKKWNGFSKNKQFFPLRNTRRAAEVWMDEYKEFYLQTVPSARRIDIGKCVFLFHRDLFIWYDDDGQFSISARLEVRNRLKCKNFTWYLQEVYPELKPMKLMKGKRMQISNGRYCLDTLGRSKAGQSIGLYQCHGTYLHTYIYIILFKLQCIFF